MAVSPLSTQGKKIKDPAKVADDARTYYEMLFADKPYDVNEQNRILRELEKTPIHKASSDNMDVPISNKEIEIVMENLPLGKQPGPDRIPNAVYKYVSSFFCAKIRHPTTAGSRERVVAK